MIEEQGGVACLEVFLWKREDSCRIIPQQKAEASTPTLQSQLVLPFAIHLCLFKRVFIFFKAINILQIHKQDASLISMYDPPVPFLGDIYVTFCAKRARGPAKLPVC